MVAQATHYDFWASEHLAQARGVSPKRDRASAYAPFSSPRLGEGGARLGETISPERGLLAWARCWARQCEVGWFSWFCMDNTCLVLGIVLKVWYEWVRYSNASLELCIMNWHEFCMRLKWNVWYERGMITIWLEVLGTWINYDVLKWVGPRSWKALA